MKRLACVGVAAALLGTTAVSTPARAYGGGFFVGTVVGLGVGAAVGAALVRPYPFFYGPYGYYPYAYYPAPYPYYYAAPPVVYAPAPAVAAPAPGRASYAPAPPAPPCRAGQFFNTLTGACDTR